MLHCISLPTPFPVGPVNVYLAEGEPLTLIDTGPKDAPTRTALEAALAQHGYRIEDIQRIILTHHHVDHIGLAAEIVARSGAEILTHAHNVPVLTDYQNHRLQQQAFYDQLWREGGVPPEYAAEMNQIGQGFTRWSDPIERVQPLQEGDILFFAAGSWQVFHTPGHAGGLICLWNAATRVLLANDHFIRDISSNPVAEPPFEPGAPRPKRLVEYLFHMERMAALEPVLALPGHGEPVEDVPGLVRQRRAFHQRRAERIRATLIEKPLTLWEITQPLFPRLKRPIDYYLGLSEVLGHLDLLVEAAQVRPLSDGAAIRWAAV